MSKHKRIWTKMTFLVLFLLIFISNNYLWAENNKTSTQKDDIEMIKSSKEAPKELLKSDKIPIMVIYQDMDSLGRRLIFNLRERFNKSNLFRLSGYNEKKIKIVISSKDEFQGRAGLSSIYCVVWTFSYGEDMLSNYLDSQVGFIEHNAIKKLAEVLASKTDEISTQYAYLFEEE